MTSTSGNKNHLNLIVIGTQIKSLRCPSKTLPRTSINRSSSTSCREQCKSSLNVNSDSDKNWKHSSYINLLEEKENASCQIKSKKKSGGLMKSLKRKSKSCDDDNKCNDEMSLRSTSSEIALIEEELSRLEDCLKASEVHKLNAVDQVNLNGSMGGSDSEAAATIQRWFRKRRNRKHELDESMRLRRVLVAKKDEINGKLRANRRLRETKHISQEMSARRASCDMSGDRQKLSLPVTTHSDVEQPQNLTSSEVDVIVQQSSDPDLKIASTSETSAPVADNKDTELTSSQKEPKEQDTSIVEQSDAFIESKKTYKETDIDEEISKQRTDESDKPIEMSKRRKNSGYDDLDVLFDNAILSTSSPDVSRHHTPTSSTYQDLLETLRLLEHEEEFDNYESAKAQNSIKRESGYSSAEAASSTLQSHGSSNKMHSLPKNEIETKLPEDKLYNIYSFLDQVDTFPVKETHLVSDDTNEDSKTTEMSGKDTVDDVENIRSRLVTLEIDVEQKNKTIQVLQKTLKEQKKENLKMARNFEDEIKNKVERQKEEYDSTVDGQLEFIDELLNDKRTLNLKIKTLTEDLKNVEEIFDDKIKLLVESHKSEIKKLRDDERNLLKKEREKWTKEKHKEIKEYTIRGLEPEVQKLMESHSQQTYQLKTQHQEELVKVREEGKDQLAKQLNDLKNAMISDKGDSLRKEKESAKQRYEKDMEEKENLSEREKLKLRLEIQEEKDRFSAYRTEQKSESEECKRASEAEFKEQIRKIGEGHVREVEDIRNEHRSTIEELTEKMSAEKDKLENDLNAKLIALRSEREDEIAERIRHGHSKDLEMTVSRLERETSLSKEKTTRAAANRIRYVREKYELEIRERDKAIDDLKQKNLMLKREMNEMDSQHRSLKSNLRQYRIDSERMNTMLQKLNDERKSLKVLIRQEFGVKIDSLESSNERLKCELVKTHSEHQATLSRVEGRMNEMQESKDKELDELHKRVKMLISKKDEAIKQLKSKHDDARRRADRLEELLDKQREELIAR